MGEEVDVRDVGRAALFEILIAGKNAFGQGLPIGPPKDYPSTTPTSFDIVWVIF